MVKQSPVRALLTNALSQFVNPIIKYKGWLFSLFILASILFAYLATQKFADLWLTRDQQGQILFNNANYAQASTTFSNTQWQAYSAYGAEEYKNAATLYSQFNDKNNLLAQANALAHAREYIKARNLYQEILVNFPDYQAAKTNMDIIQGIIDEVNLLSESQRAEQGESSKELGDEPQTGDGAKRNDGNQDKIEQLSSEQLLLDANLNDMWLRQVQKNPARFLSQKFYMQIKQNNEDTSTGGKQESAND